MVDSYRADRFRKSLSTVNSCLWQGQPADGPRTLAGAWQKTRKPEETGALGNEGASRPSRSSMSLARRSVAGHGLAGAQRSARTPAEPSPNAYGGRARNSDTWPTRRLGVGPIRDRPGRSGGARHRGSLLLLHHPRSPAGRGGAAEPGPAGWCGTQRTGQAEGGGGLRRVPNRRDHLGGIPPIPARCRPRGGARPLYRQRGPGCHLGPVEHPERSAPGHQAPGRSGRPGESPGRPWADRVRHSRRASGAEHGPAARRGLLRRAG